MDLPLDQWPSVNQELLFAAPQFGENSGLDRGVRLHDHGHFVQGIESAGHLAQNYLAFEWLPALKNTYA